MPLNHPAARQPIRAPDLDDATDDLAELVDDAAKALSIGGSLQSAGEFREAVDTLRHEFEHDGATE